MFPGNASLHSVGLSPKDEKTRSGYEQCWGQGPSQRRGAHVVSDLLWDARVARWEACGLLPLRALA